MKWAEKNTRRCEEKEDPEEITLQMVCQLDSNSRTQAGAFLVPACFHLMIFRFIINRNFINKYSFSHWVSGEKSFYRILSENGLNCLVYWPFLSAKDIFGSPMWQAHRHTEKKGREIGGREWWLSEGERGSQNSPGRQCVRSGALGPFGWLTVNGCPGEVTRLIENRLRGEGNAFALCLAPWPTVQRLPWQFWNPTYLFATLWRERVEQLSE